MLQQLSTVTLHFPACLPEFSSSFQLHGIQQVACHWRGVQMQSLSSLPTFLPSSTQFVLSQITQFWFMTMAKTKRTPHQPLVFTNPRGLAACIAATRPSPCCLQPPRAHCPPGYLTQDQRGERSRSLMSTVVAVNATKPADDSGDDNNDNDEDDVWSIGKKGNDGGDDEQRVKEGGMSAATKATKPGGDDSEDDDDNKEEDKDNEEVQKGGKKQGGKDDDPSASMGTSSSLSSSDEVVT
jgi:hypothetical protein